MLRRRRPRWKCGSDHCTRVWAVRGCTGRWILAASDGRYFLFWLAGWREAINDGNFKLPPLSECELCDCVLCVGHQYQQSQGNVDNGCSHQSRPTGQLLWSLRHLLRFRRKISMPPSWRWLSLRPEAPCPAINACTGVQVANVDGTCIHELLQILRSKYNVVVDRSRRYRPSSPGWYLNLMGF
jgi:hypothetical protein